MTEYENISKNAKERLKAEFDHCVRAKSELNELNKINNTRINSMQEELSSEKEKALKSENQKRDLEIELTILKSMVDRKIQELTLEMK